MSEETKPVTPPAEQKPIETPPATGFTPEMVERMQEMARKQEKEFDARLAQEKVNWKTAYDQEIQALQVRKEQETVISSIEADEALKEQFKHYDIDYSNLDSAELNKWLQVFTDKKEEKTVTPEGDKIPPSSPTSFNSMADMVAHLDKSGSK